MTFFFYIVCILFGLIYLILGNDPEGHPDIGHGTGNDFENIEKSLGVFLGLFKSIIWSYYTAIGGIEFPNGSAWTKLKARNNETRYANLTSGGDEI